MKKVKLGEICEILSGNAFKSKEYVENGIRVIRITNVQKGEIVDDDPKFMSFNSEEKYSRYLLEEGDILISQTGNVGRVGRVPSDILPAFLNQRVAKISNKSWDHLLDEYLFWVLNNDAFERDAMYDSSGVAQKNLSMKWIKDYQIPLPSLSEQKVIVKKLDRAQRLIDIDKEMLDKYDDLIQSVFLEMFGDPVTNPKGWEVGSVTDYGSLKNGLNYSSNESGTKIRSLGVGDFGVLSKIDNVRAISRIELDEAPPENYLLKDSDLVFVRSNGNKELVGRCLVIYPGNEDVTFSGFCIRYRPNSSSINSTYLSHLFRVKSFRNYMLKDGRGANIQNINQKLLSQLDIPLPEISKQNQFAKNVEILEGQILKTQTSLRKSEELFSSLVQRTFN